MENGLIEKIINALKDELKRDYPDFKGIYFFGSRARGDYNDDSDYDLVLVFDRVIDWRFKDNLRRRVIDYEIDYSILIDSHIYNYQDIIEPITPFREKVKNEGIYYDA
ncbi:MAG: transf 2 protein [Ignavibacteria bacterium]|nr:transf 2 protein [Ignavibacteria bacterium]